MNHVTREGEAVPCFGARCKVCRKIDRAGPEYDERYRRLFHPEEFPDREPDPAAPQPGGGPSLARQAVSFGKAIVAHAVAGLPRADDATAEARMEICRSCPSFDAERTRCLSCGCNLDVKIYWSEQKCPLDKW